jgi:transcriptional regulator GlxA family with amidase domain
VVLAESWVTEANQATDRLLRAVDLRDLPQERVSRLFKKSTGRTVPRYINELRVARACRLLVETERTVNEIARDCGYVSLANFQHQFQLLEGRSPQEYRRAVRRTG